MIILMDKSFSFCLWFKVWGFPEQNTPFNVTFVSNNVVISNMTG